MYPRSCRTRSSTDVDTIRTTVLQQVQWGIDASGERESAIPVTSCTRGDESCGCLVRPARRGFDIHQQIRSQTRFAQSYRAFMYHQLAEGDPPLRRLRRIPKTPVRFSASIAFEVDDGVFEFDPGNGPSPRQQGPQYDVDTHTVGASQVARRRPRDVAEKHMRAGDACDRAEVDIQVTANRERAAGGARHIPLERALEPVPVERDGEGRDADQDQGADRGRQRPWSLSAQYLRDAVHQLNVAIGASRAVGGLP